MSRASGSPRRRVRAAAMIAATRNPPKSRKPTIPVWASSRNSRLCVQLGSSPVRRAVR